MIGSSPIVGGVLALVRFTSPLQWVPLLSVLSLCMRVYPATYMQRSGIHIFLVIILSVSILNLLCCCVVSSFPVFPLIPVGSSRPYKFFYWYFLCVTIIFYSNCLSQLRVIRLSLVLISYFTLVQWACVCMRP